MASIVRKPAFIAAGASLLAVVTAMAWPARIVARPDPAAGAIAFARAHAGDRAVDCGRASTVRGTTSALDTCMADALRARRAFVGVLDERGRDSAVGRVWSSTASGDVRQYRFDSDPSGGGGATPTVTMFDCSEPAVEVADGGRRIRCATEPGSAVYK